MQSTSSRSEQQQEFFLIFFSYPRDGVLDTAATSVDGVITSSAATSWMDTFFSKGAHLGQSGQGFVLPLAVEAPVVAVLPVAAYTVAILHANNVRDIWNDSKIGAVTVATTLGESHSKTYYDFLLFGMAHLFAVVIGLFYLESVGYAVCSAWVLPLSIWLSRRIRGGSALLHDQDEKTAKTGMLFGLALCIGTASMPSMLWCSVGWWACGVCVVVLHVLG